MSAPVDAQFTAGMDSRQYESSITRMQSRTASASVRMVADIAATQKATERLASGVDHATRRMHAIGNVSNQVADVAVQLETGTNAARVFGQQGSQIAAAFGPQGAILGAVIAIGAGIWTWVTGAEKANKAFEEGEKRLKAMESAIEKGRERNRENQKATVRANLSGPGQEFERQRFDERMRHEEAIAEIEKEALTTGDMRAKQIAEEIELTRHKAEMDAIWHAQSRDEHEKRTAREKEAASKKEKADNEREQRERKFEQMQKDYLNWVEKKTDEIHKKELEDFDEREREFKRQMKTVEEYNDLQSKLEKEQKKAAIDASAKRGNAILKDIENRKAGISASDIRREAREKASDERKAIDRQLAKEGVGKGLGSREREAARRARAAQIAGDINAAKNQDKLKAVIDGDSIQKLRDEIKNVMNELLPK